MELSGTDLTRPDVGVSRRKLLLGGGAAAAGAAAGVSWLGDRPQIALAAAPSSSPFAAPKPAGFGHIPAAARPGGAYDRFVAKLAAEDKFSGVVVLSHDGRTVLSRAYGMADEQKQVLNDPNTAFGLSSAGQPFLAVALLQLVQQGRLRLSDTVGQHLKGFDRRVAKQVTVHHLLSLTAGLEGTQVDPKRIFTSKAEVHRFLQRSARKVKLVAVPGSADQAHTDDGGAALTIAALILEAVTGTTYWDYVHKHVFRRAGMRRSSFFTTTQWRNDPRIAHAYMSQPDGSRVDAARNLGTDSLSPQGPHENPARSFVGYAGSGGFASALDLVRFAQALYDGRLLSRPLTHVLFSAIAPGPEPSAYTAYAGPIQIIKGPQWLYGRGGSTGGVGANWNVYPDTGWVGVVLTNRDDVPFVDILQKETHAISGEPIRQGGGGGG